MEGFGVSVGFKPLLVRFISMLNSLSTLLAAKPKLSTLTTCGRADFRPGRRSVYPDAFCVDKTNL
jgi:hypothetical protein